MPIRHWLKNEMNEWAKNIIKESNTEHLINKSYLLKLLDDHCQNKADNSRKIWTVLMFMMWHDVYVEKNTPSRRSMKLRKSYNLKDQGR
ncbi:asparagine synthetase [Mesobacillus boroniphilus JCM 21738]|uniref:Asparagine synthetase n=1 Tax=Mesobacillus boroniphilus JCM 21738 TaxID=1294265 RepID=W4RP51_9BACI|nr:asparagine synthetase [Mesobacillus boroniphilus JCM 21738]